MLHEAGKNFCVIRVRSSTTFTCKLIYKLNLAPSTIKVCKNTVFEVLPGNVCFSAKVALRITSNNINLKTENCILVSAAVVTKSDRTSHHQDMVRSSVASSTMLGHLEQLGPDSAGFVVGHCVLEAERNGSDAAEGTETYAAGHAVQVEALACTAAAEAGLAVQEPTDACNVAAVAGNAARTVADDMVVVANEGHDDQDTDAAYWVHCERGQ